jgi:HPt (histidine-containing phosphotransfer) domain-containing protein
MDDYLTKPIQVTALQEVLERVGRRVRQRMHSLEAPETSSEGRMPMTSEERQEVASPALDAGVLADLRQLQAEGEPDILQELAQAFQCETPPLLEALRKAVAEGKPEQLNRAAHNLKGSSNNLGARTMAGLSAELEVLGKNGTVEGAAELSTRLEQEYRRVCLALASERVGTP